MTTVICRTYEPPVAPHGTPFVVGEEWQLAPGVLGWAFACGNWILIPLLRAEREGAGDVGRFLDSLSLRCVIVGVISPRLAGMLVRRGFRPTRELYDGEWEDWWRAPALGSG